MNFNEFTKQVTILQGEKAIKLRNKFIHKFVNTDSDYYKSKILQKIKYSDGEYYSGYLWEILLSPKIITEEDAYLKLKGHETNIYILWDLHSAHKIVKKEYWYYPRDAILYLNPEVLINGMAYLPEDIYLFDDSYQWSIVFTHESTHDEKRLCYTI